MPLNAVVCISVLVMIFITMFKMLKLNFFYFCLMGTKVVKYLSVHSKI